MAQNTNKLDGFHFSFRAFITHPPRSNTEHGITLHNQSVNTAPVEVASSSSSVVSVGPLVSPAAATAIVVV